MQSCLYEEKKCRLKYFVRETFSQCKMRVIVIKSYKILKSRVFRGSARTKGKYTPRKCRSFFAKSNDVKKKKKKKSEREEELT